MRTKATVRTLLPPSVKVARVCEDAIPEGLVAIKSSEITVFAVAISTVSGVIVKDEMIGLVGASARAIWFEPTRRARAMLAPNTFFIFKIRKIRFISPPLVMKGNLARRPEADMKPRKSDVVVDGG